MHLSKRLRPLHALLGALLLAGATSSQAALLLVTVKADSYDGQCNLHCSLRDAVKVANQSADADIILLPSGTYKLTRRNLRVDNQPIDEDDNLIGDLDVTGELLIKGGGIGKSIIEGLTDDLFAVEHRLLENRPGARLRLERLTLSLGRSADNGGALENHGSLVLRDMQALENITREWGEVDGGRGGAIANYGELLVLDSRFEGNGAIKESSNPLGGAIFNSGDLQVRRSHFVDNGLGGLPLSGAGSAIYSATNAGVESSSFIRNTAGELADGGAITNEGGELTVTNSTFSANREGALTNGRNDEPPAIRSKATLTNVTIVDGIAELSGRYAVMNWGELMIRNSLIAGNREQFGDDPINCRNFGSNFSYQAIGLLRNDEPANCGADLFVPLEQTFTQVLSATLTSDGKTFFHALLPGSPAIDAGIGDCSAQDQRGVSRPRDGNGDGVAVCDLGAYELKP
ncbi:MAG TPA: choice-of-anchor Q domain-containing protein [Pseudomonas sp.]|nr:choice-of-anchor Q domain-containing protein [Pseudomonas sp.]